MTIPNIVTIANETVNDAVPVMNNFNAIKNAMNAGLEDENIKSNSITASSKLIAKSIVESLLSDALVSKLYPTGVPTPFAYGINPPGKIPPTADPDWWPCDGTAINALSSSLNGLTTDNLNSGLFLRGGASHTGIIEGADSHTHTGTTDGETEYGAWSKQFFSDNGKHHKHDFTTGSSNNIPRHIKFVYWLKL